MKTGSITYRLPAQADAYRQIPSVSCGTTSFRSFIVLLLIICCLGQFEKFCIYVNIKQKNYTRPLQHKKIVYGLTHYVNVTFTKTCILSLMCINLFVLFLSLSSQEIYTQTQDHSLTRYYPQTYQRSSLIT